MRIATMVTGCFTSPEPDDVTYASIGVAIAISRGLFALGHQVDYYAPEGSRLDIPIVTCGLKPFPKNDNGNYEYPNVDSYGQTIISRTWDEYLIREMVRRANMGDYDALIIHAADRSILLGGLTKIPIIYTLHDPVSTWFAEICRTFLTPNQHLVSIANSQRNLAPDLPYFATVYNGTDIDKFSFVETPEDYVVFAGRMIPVKNPADAVRAAKLSGVPIKLFGEVPDNSEYFNNDVKPQLDENAMYCGFVDQLELARQYGCAKALLAPIKWEEPFGLVFIEAMACGTPVIAFRRGSVSEIITDGVTGFIVDTVEEMAEAIQKIDSIDRKKCRQHVIDNFSNQRMVSEYDSILRRLVEKK